MDHNEQKLTTSWPQNNQNKLTKVNKYFDHFDFLYFHENPFLGVFLIEIENFHRKKIELKMNFSAFGIQTFSRFTIFNLILFPPNLTCSSK